MVVPFPLFFSVLIIASLSAPDAIVGACLQLLRSAFESPLGCHKTTKPRVNLHTGRVVRILCGMTQTGILITGNLTGKREDECQCVFSGVSITTLSYHP